MEQLQIDLSKYSIAVKKHNLRIVVDYYYELRGWDKRPKEFWVKNQKNPKYNYARNMKEAKQLYENQKQNLQNTLSILYLENQRSKEFSDYDWRILTALKRIENNEKNQIKN